MAKFIRIFVSERHLLLIRIGVWSAVFALTLALIAVLATMLTGDPFYDAAGSIVIGVLLVVVAIFVAKEVHDLLIGQSVDPEQRAAMPRSKRLSGARPKPSITRWAHVAWGLTLVPWSIRNCACAALLGCAWWMRR